MATCPTATGSRWPPVAHPGKNASRPIDALTHRVNPIPAPCVPRPPRSLHLRPPPPRLRGGPRRPRERQQRAAGVPEARPGHRVQPPAAMHLPPPGLPEVRGAEGVVRAGRGRHRFYCVRRWNRGARSLVLCFGNKLEEI